MAKLTDVLTGLRSQGSVYRKALEEIVYTVTTHPDTNSTVLDYLLTISRNEANHLINPKAEKQEISAQSNLKT